MANIDNLLESVAKAEAKVEKCKKTIERHEKQLEKKITKVKEVFDIDLTGKNAKEVDDIREPYRMTDDSWLFFEVTSKLNDIIGANQKLQSAEKTLAKWQEKLDIKKNEIKFVEDNAPEVIKNFLEDWKTKVYNWNVKRYDKYLELKKSLYEQQEKTIIEYVESHPDEFEHYFIDGKLIECRIRDLVIYGGRGLAKYLKENEMTNSHIGAELKDFAGGTVMTMTTFYDEKERLQWLESSLEQEKQAKLLDLIYRITGITGEITDARYLKVSPKGNLDGYVIGEKGKASIETIGAGGYAIQVFHYRTLIHKIK